MAAAGRGPAGGLRSVRDRLLAAPYEFDFFQAVRLLERLHPDRRPVGRQHPPADEVARFRGHLSLSFPPSPIFELLPPDEDRPNSLLTVTFLGLYGPSGVLPTHYTQLLLDINRDVRGPERRSLRDWLDLFNHRFVSLFYRAWEKYRFHIPYERGEAFADESDTFTLALLSLVGVGTPGLRHRLRIDRPARADDRAGGDEWGRPGRAEPLASIDDLALVYYAGLFAQRPRNAASLQLLLADYFQLPAEVQQFRGQWLLIDPANQSRLGGLGTLGVDAVAGSRVWDVQSRFRLRLGPLSYRQFEELLPDRGPVPERKMLFLVMQLARLFVGPELDFDVQLVLDAEQVPDAVLGDQPGFGPRLGWNVWLVSAPPPADPDDAVFEAEWVTGV